MTRPLLLALALLATSASAQDVDRGVVEGDLAPTFETMTIGRDTLRLVDLRGRYVLLEFWGTWCSPCVAYAPRLAALYARYPRDRFEIVGVALDQAEAVREFTEARGLAWPQVVEPNRAGRPVTDLYGVSGYPTTFLIDPEGRVVYRTDGYGESLEAVLAEALE